MPAARSCWSSVGLLKFKDAYPHELSGSMKQRVAIVRALAWNPPILLMDEPFSALDELTRAQLQDDLLQLWNRERKTVLFVTHNISEAVYLADRVVVMSPPRSDQNHSVAGPLTPALGGACTRAPSSCTGPAPPERP